MKVILESTETQAVIECISEHVDQKLNNNHICQLLKENEQLYYELIEYGVEKVKKELIEAAKKHFN